MKKKTGTITSTKMTGTVTVTVDALSFHPKYKKRFKVSKKFLADSSGHDVHDGDLVLIGECRPLSKRKHFRIIEVIKKAAEVDDVLEEADVEKAMHRQKEDRKEADEESTPVQS